MVYLKSFCLVDEMDELKIISEKKNIYNSLWPLKIFTGKCLSHINFEPITIFYGGNGSGKTTLLNIIASKLHASSNNNVKFGELFGNYVICCKEEMCLDLPSEIKLILSDDVFDYLIDVRAINSCVNRRKDVLGDEYLHYKYNQMSDNSFATYDELRNKVDANKMTMSRYIRSRLKNNNIVQESNGETALSFWQEEIKEDAIYIIDEPENSLSAENQLKLKQFIEESARFYNCQFIIATHSPFILSLKDAKIYDLDEQPVVCKEWTKLKNVRSYYDFFKENMDNFEKDS